MEHSAPMDTKDFAVQMDRLANIVQALTLEASEKRHTANGAVNSVVLALQEAQAIQGDKITLLEQTAKETNETLQIVRDLSTRMLGNDRTQAEGLIHEVRKLDARVGTLDVKHTKLSDKVGRLVFAGVAIFFAFGCVGGIITWILSVNSFAATAGH